MSSKIITGKPGSGKSYHCISLLAQDIEDWARYELQEGEPYPRKALINIPVNLEKFNEYISSVLGTEIDVSHYIE